MEFSVLLFVSITCSPATEQHWEDTGCIFTASHEYFYELVKIPLSLLFPDWTVPSLSFSSHAKIPILWSTQCPLLHSWCNISVPFLFQQSPGATTLPQMCHAPGLSEHQGMISSGRAGSSLRSAPQMLLAAFATRVHCLLVFNLVSALPAKLLPKRLAPAASCCPGYPAPRARHRSSLPCLPSAGCSSSVMSLNASTAIQGMDCSVQFCVSCRLAEGAPSHQPSL